MENSTTTSLMNFVTTNNTDKKSQNKKLFIGGLPSNSTSEGIKSLLSKKVETLDVVLKLRTNNKKCLGHGIVTTTEQGALKLLSIGQFDYGGRIIKITPFRGGKDLVKFRKELTRRRFFIKNLPEDVKVEDISGHFSRYGPIESCYLRGEPSIDLKIAVLIYKEKRSALMAYQDYRFGKLNFEKILRRYLHESIWMEFRFSDFQNSRKRRNSEETSGSSTEDRTIVSYRQIESFSKKPGHSGFVYSRGNSKNYVLRPRKFIRMGRC